jgi:pimeloyl-ACP methyl ester carboxylesterase
MMKSNFAPRSFLFFFILFAAFWASAFEMRAPAGFTQEKVAANGTNINVYKGGSGQPLLLIHGYAQSALMWTPAMNALKNQYTIIVPDLRGAGLSDAPESGYDKVNMAQDMKAVLDHYHISKARVVGHDIGLMVAYAFAAKYPEMTEKLVVMDAFIPGVGAGDTIYNSPQIWHFRFNGPYPEKLVSGRENIFFDSLWEGFSARAHSFPDDHKKYYLSQYSRPGRMHAGFSYFQTMPQDAKDNKELAKTKLTMPVLSLGGEKSLGGPLGESMKVVSDSVTIKVVPNCGHWMLEECPKETLETLKNFLQGKTLATNSTSL